MQLSHHSDTLGLSLKSTSDVGLSITVALVKTSPGFAAYWGDNK